MARPAWLVAAVLAAAICLAGAPARAQAPETLDDVSQDIDLLRQLQDYDLTADQLKGLAGVLQTIEAQRAALADYRQSEAALGPMRALRDALLRGEAAAEQEDAVQIVWDKLAELDTAVEDATAGAGTKLAALLTDEQLAALTSHEDAAYDQADRIFADLESARGFPAETYAAWRDRTAREAAFRAAGEGEEKAKAIQAKVVQFLDKTRDLEENAFYEQSDELFEELTSILAEAQPQPIRAISEARAAEQLEYLVRAERALGVVEARIKALGG
ncbi:MAG: hypothetical protein FJX74_01340 [Armatimonadetes bacterium]|nr:hypothetical protein [Armatimonadota bacterium]